MNRRHNSSQYLETVAKLKEARPDLQFSSDFIVGFPGETDEDFNNLMKLIEDVGFDNSYSFLYKGYSICKRYGF